MPWNSGFNTVLGGAAGGMAQLGRGATLAQILAAAAMGSTEAMSYVEEFKLKQREMEERRRIQEEDRQMRLEDRAARMKEMEDRRAEIAAQEAAGRARDEYATEHFDPNFVGPARQDLPPEAFPKPGDLFDYQQKKQETLNEQASLAEDLKFLLDNNIPPPSRPEEIKRFASKLREDKAFPEKQKGISADLAYRMGRDQMKDDEEYGNWQSGFLGDLQKSTPEALQTQEAAKWDKQYAEIRQQITGRQDMTDRMLAEINKPPTGRTVQEDIDALAKTLTERSIGPRPGELPTRSTNRGPMANRLGQTRPTPPPKDQQPFPAGLTGLPPTGSEVASPTGATAPPSIVPRKNVVPSPPPALDNLSAQIDAAIPDMDPRMKINAEAQIKLEMLKNPRITPAQAIQDLKQQYEQYQFQMRGFPNLMGTPGGGR